eukprot:1296463-Rhodomonas_salina.2
MSLVRSKLGRQSRERRKGGPREERGYRCGGLPDSEDGHIEGVFVREAKQAHHDYQREDEDENPEPERRRKEGTKGQNFVVADCVCSRELHREHADKHRRQQLDGQDAVHLADEAQAHQLRGIRHSASGSHCGLEERVTVIVLLVLHHLGSVSSLKTLGRRTRTKGFSCTAGPSRR